MSAPLMPESVTMEEMETATAAPTAPNLEMKLDGDAVPEELRGKSVAELVQMQKGLADSLRLSEQSRKQMETNYQLSQQRQPEAVAPVVKEPELTDEALAELHQNDPLKAIRYMQDQAIRAASTNLESRLGTLFSSTAAQAESQARTKYAKEFESLGPEISQMIQQIPNAKSMLTTADAWDRLISLVRGSPGNFEKMTQVYAGRTPEVARAAQHEDTGLSLRSAVRAPAPTSAAALDATQLEIAQKLGLTPQEYTQWSKV